MENNERYTDKLAKYMIAAAGLGLVGVLCWYFRSVLAYILIAVVVSLIGKPLMGLLQKITIKGKKAPDWFLATLTLLLVMGSLLTLMSLIVPLISSIIKDVSMTNIENAARSIAVPLADLNSFLRESFPKLGSDFRIEVAIGHEVQKLFNVAAFSSIIGSAASIITDFGVPFNHIAIIGCVKLLIVFIAEKVV